MPTGILLSYRDMQKVRKVFTRSVMHVVKRAHKVSDAAQDEEGTTETVLELFTVYTAQQLKDGIYLNMELAGKPVKRVPSSARVHPPFFIHW